MRYKIICLIFYQIMAFMLFIVGLAVGLLLFILFGYLWNYVLIQELRNTNRKLDELTDAIGVNLNKIANNTIPESRRNSNFRECKGYNKGD